MSEESTSLADMMLLNTLKQRLRETTKVLDTSRKVYGNGLEVSQVKHEVLVLVAELQIHSLLPREVRLARQATQRHQSH